MKQYIFGIDLGGTTVKLGLFTLEGKLLDKWEIPTRTADAGAEILPDIAAALKAKQEERGISVSQVAGVGLGVPAQCWRIALSSPASISRAGAATPPGR